MKAILKKKLWAYIVHNNPDLMISLQEEGAVDNYLDNKIAAAMPMVNQLLSEEKPVYIVEELSLNELTEDLKPSRYNYILSIIEEEFPIEYAQMKENGTLVYEVVNMIEACKEIFDVFDFSVANQTNRFLKYAIIGQVHDYLA